VTTTSTKFTIKQIAAENLKHGKQNGKHKDISKELTEEIKQIIISGVQDTSQNYTKRK
jgi:hypothetical protein